MNDLIARVSEVNRSFERAYVAWMQENDMGEPDPVLRPPFAKDELASLEDAAGAPLTDELEAFLVTDGARVSLALGSPGMKALGLAFAWLDSATMLEETRKLRAAAEEYGWEIPPCVPLSAEGELIAYRLDTRRMIRISAHDDGDVDELELGLSELLEKYTKAVETQLAAGFAA